MQVEEFLNVICEALHREPNTLSLDDTPETVEQWDSLGHLRIIAAMDSCLRVSVNDDELQNFRSLRELVARLKCRGVLEE
jgi:acyl carrier protein